LAAIWQKAIPFRFENDDWTADDLKVAAIGERRGGGFAELPIDPDETACFDKLAKACWQDYSDFFRRTYLAKLRLETASVYTLLASPALPNPNATERTTVKAENGCFDWLCRQMANGAQQPASKK
jgi:hypothetical protein